MGQEPEHCVCEISGKGGGMTAYYNEIDQHAAYWLRELIKSGHIADGIVDERDIQDVMPNDLAGFTQCHFLPESAGGLTRCGNPDGQMIDMFGLVPVRANLSARQAKALRLLTSGTYGQHFTISSESTALSLFW